MTKQQKDSFSNTDIQDRLSALTPFLQRYALGDFSEMVPVPEEEDAFTELLVAVNLMVEDFQELLREQDETIEKLSAAEKQLEQERRLLSELVNAIDEVIYVSDPDTYELLHINQTFKEIWGEDSLGKICYQVLQGRESPCPFCTNDLIFGEYLGRSYVWEFQNEVSGDWYRCTDKAISWLDDKLVRFELASKITDQKEAQDKLKENLARVEKFNRLAVDRESRMIELKQEVNRLSTKLGQGEPFDLSFLDREGAEAD